MQDTDRLQNDLCSSGVTQPDSVAVLLLIMLPVSADSVSLRGALDQFDSNDSREARDPEFPLESLPDRGERIKILALVLQEKTSAMAVTHPLALPVGALALFRGRGTGRPGFTSALLKSTSPAVSRLAGST